MENLAEFRLESKNLYKRLNEQHGWSDRLKKEDGFDDAIYMVGGGQADDYEWTVYSRKQYIDEALEWHRDTASWIADTLRSEGKSSDVWLFGDKYIFDVELLAGAHNGA